jgi:GrpB-like predicted nucleotidyltransferase (UPF0157 family)
VFPAGCPETDRMVRFRDWKYMQQYADAKSGVVTQIMARAMAD